MILKCPMVPERTLCDFVLQHLYDEVIIRVDLCLLSSCSAPQANYVANYHVC